MNPLSLRILLTAAWLVGSSTSFSFPSPAGANKNNDWMDKLTSLLPGAEKPIIVCTTAPSLEGMAFCRSVIDRDRLRVRALARNVDSPRARALRDMGCEVVRADNLDAASLERAFERAHGVYAITTWSGSAFAADRSVLRASDLGSAALEDGEVLQGRNIVWAAEGTMSPRHLVLQSLHRDRREAPARAVAGRAPLHHPAKWEQEEILVGSSLPYWSVLRQPTYL